MTDAQIAKLARIQACYVETVALQAEGGRLMNLEEVSAHSGDIDDNSRRWTAIQSRLMALADELRTLSSV